MIALVMVLALPGITSAAPAFKDVTGHWAAKDIQTALDRGYVAGYPDGTFKPNGTITRAEAAGVLSRITRLTPGTESHAFADLEGHWSRDQVRKLVALGFIDAKDYPGGFEPDKAVTRYEVMKWIASGLAKSEPDFAQALMDTKDTLLPTTESFKGGIEAGQIPYIALVRGTGIIAGFPDGTFKPANNTTRAEVIATLLRYEKVEGTDAKSYKDLNELREVGLTGSNLLSATDFYYHFREDNSTDFAGIRDEKITGINKLVSVKLHRLLFIPKSGSVYFDLFMSDAMKDLQSNATLGYMQVIEEISVTINVDKLTNASYMREFDNAGLISYSGFPYRYADVIGVNDYMTLYRPGVIEDGYAKKGETFRLWYTTMQLTDYGNSIVTDDGSEMIVRRVRENNEL